MFSLARGEKDRIYSGFRKRGNDTKWQLSERNYKSWCQQTSAPSKIVSLKWKDGKRPTVGDKVMDRVTGRRAVVSSDDRSDMPYLVVFEDEAEPRTKWCNEAEVQWVQH